MKNLLLILYFLPFSIFGQIHHIKSGGSGDGSSWVNASGDLQQILLNANAGDTVWIAEGAYLPSDCSSCTEADREETFLIAEAITILGGFPNSGEPTLDDRNWEVFSTTLSGEIGVSNDSTDNSFHVITVAQNVGDVKIDGINIRQGNADGGTNANGAGLLCQSCTATGGLKMINCAFSDNTTIGNGGAYYSTGSNDIIDLEQCRFENNSAFRGGAVYTGELSSVLKNCWFSNNAAKQGGAIYSLDKNTKLLGCAFYQNEAIEGGAFYVDEIYNDPDLVLNCTFAENSGSAVFFKFVDNRVYLYNNLFWKNEGYDVEVSDYDIYVLDYGSPVYILSTLTDKYNELQVCNVEFGGCTIYDATNPFEDLENGNLNLAIGSSAIGAGGNTDVIISDNGLTTDFNDNPRIFENIDLGAFELQTNNCSGGFGNIVYVNPAAAGNNDGSSWQHAFTNLQDGLNLAANCGVDSVWVAEGLYLPEGCTGCDISDPRKFSFQFPFRRCGGDILPAFTLYGGFPVVGNPDINDRDWENYPTILSGNIGDPGTNTDNVYHILRSSGSAILDGVIIQDGYADGSESKDQIGAGILAADNVQLYNCTVKNNYAANDGGAVYTLNGATNVFQNCSIFENEAGHDGGVFYNDYIDPRQTRGKNFEGKLTVTESTVVNNIAGNNGGAFYGTSVNFYDCIVQNNSAAGLGGAFYTQHHKNKNTLSNSEFTNNTAQSGGAGYIYGRSNSYNTNGLSILDSRLTASNCVFSQNTAQTTGGALNCKGCEKINLNNSLFEQNHAGTGSGAIEIGSISAFEPNTSASMSNCTFAFNTSDSGANVFAIDEKEYGDSLNINNLIFWGNHTPNNTTAIKGEVELAFSLFDQSNCAEVSPDITCGENIYFDAPNPFVDAQNGNFELNDSTQAIDNGTPDLTDMGAFQYGDLPSDCTTPVILLSTQSEVDSFAWHYPGLTDISCDLLISGSTITNLDSLSMITSIGGDLIIQDNSNLIIINGFENLETIGGTLKIIENEGLNNIYAFKNLAQIGKDLIFKENEDLINIDSFSNLITISERLIIERNLGLTSINGFTNLESVGRNLHIHNNGLTSLSGLGNLNSVGGDFSLFYNHLTNFEGLDSLTSIGGAFKIVENNSLENLSGLSNLSSIGGHFKLEKNDVLLNLEGAENLESIGSSIIIEYNDALVNLEGLNGLSVIHDRLRVYRNNAMLTFNGLENVDTIGGTLDINYNQGLMNIQGLEGLNFVGGDFIITANTEMIELTQFPELTNIGGDLKISNNYNLTTINGFSSLNEIGVDLIIRGNDALIGFESLENLSWIGRDFYVSHNESLTEFANFENITTINRDLRLVDCPVTDLLGFSNITSVANNVYIRNSAATNLNGLHNLVTVGGSFYLENALYISSLEGLDKLTSIGSNFLIERNSNLNSLNGIDSLTLIGGGIYFYYNSSLEDISALNVLNPEDIDFLRIEKNYHLSTCYEPFVCSYLNLQKPSQIYNNETGCDNKLEVICYCENDDQDGDGFPLGEDCDDTNADVNPDAVEIIYNGLDDDCDPLTLDDDLDQDGFVLAEDCDDENADINPDAVEIPNNDIDENCDGYIAQDADNDGFFDDVDCDDNNADINPDATEIVYNGLDDDCDPLTLDDDLDQDGFVLAEDCDDENADINPDAEEIPNNGIDEDCDGEDLTISNKEVTRAHLEIFPNPTTGVVTIILPPSLNADLKVKDKMGQAVKIQQLDEKNEIDLSDFPEGVYILMIKTKDNLIVEKVIKLNP